MNSSARLISAILCLILLLAVSPSLATAPECKPLCTSCGPTLTIATGSPGELSLLKELADAFCKQKAVTLCWKKAGSGAALRLLKQGKADVALVHAPGAEKQAVAQGWATDRTLIGGNRFYLVGPSNDPAFAAQAKNMAKAYARIAGTLSLFITRADGSGTHKRETALWRQAKIEPKGPWYIPSHDFMMASLRLAARKKAYFMTDSSTWIVGRARYGLEGLAVLRANDPDLFNTYHALRRANHGGKAKLAEAFIAFLVSPAGQQIITTYGARAYGQPLYENADRALKAR